MANSTSNIDQVLTAQAQKEVIVNQNFDAASAAMGFGRRASTSVGLVWGYYGGTISNAGTPTQIANGTLTLAASDTTYIYRTAAGVVTQTTSIPASWPGPLAADAKAMYEVVTGASAVTSYTDYRTVGGDTGPAGATGSNGANGTNWAVSVNAQTGTTYSLQASDNGKVVTLSNGSSITLTVPSGLGANFACELIQIGAGQVTVTASGVTLNSYTSVVKLSGQHAAATLIAYAADVFNLSGNLTA